MYLDGKRPDVLVIEKVSKLQEEELFKEGVASNDVKSFDLDPELLEYEFRSLKVKLNQNRKLVEIEVDVLCLGQVVNLFKLSTQSHGGNLNGYNCNNKEIADISVIPSETELKTSFYNVKALMDDNQFGQSQMVNGALNGVRLLCIVYEGKFDEKEKLSSMNSTQCNLSLWQYVEKLMDNLVFGLLKWFKLLVLIMVQFEFFSFGFLKVFGTIFNHSEDKNKWC
jgi:hypothetical protein